MLIRCTITAAVFLLGATSVAAQDEVSPQTRWAQVAACAGERSNERRHACVDSVLRAAGALDAATEAAINRDNFGRSERIAPSPAPPPEQVAAAAPSSSRLPEQRPSTTGISTQIASARAVNNRQLRVVTTEGAVWQQVDSDVIRRIPRAGETFEVRDGALGSFRCTANGNTTFRCQRQD